MTLNQLIEKLKEPDFREKAMYEFSVIAPGNWEAIVKWAEHHNCTTTVQELKQFAVQNTGFFQGNGKQPNLGWAKATLDEG